MVRATEFLLSPGDGGDQVVRDENNAHLCDQGVDRGASIRAGGGRVDHPRRTRINLARGARTI